MQAVLTPPAEMDKELACQLQEEEMVVEEAWLEQDAATLEVVIEATSPLTCSQLEGLGAVAKQVVVPSQVAMLSEPSMAVVV